MYRVLHYADFLKSAALGNSEVSLTTKLNKKQIRVLETLQRPPGCGERLIEAPPPGLGHKPILESIGDLEGATISLGKALNEPIQGITALRRQGVQLSEQQEQQIRDFMAVNDVVAAQRVLLAELETQFGGAAAAARRTFGGALKALDANVVYGAARRPS